VFVFTRQTPQGKNAPSAARGLPLKHLVKRVCYESAFSMFRRVRVRVLLVLPMPAAKVCVNR